jgi:methylthioribose-1-phosphate isomerase
MNYVDVADAIKRLVVRGAPAIGVTAAFGLALAALNCKTSNLKFFLRDLSIAYSLIRSTRPTAVNLQWALDRIMEKIKNLVDISQIKKVILDEALLIRF